MSKKAKPTDNPNVSFSAFRRTVLGHWKEYGRHDLPWRAKAAKRGSSKKELDPYKILVSEMMLQQTQVPRVIEKYKEFLHAFPSASKLARAPLKDVLRVWSGLGYNRRGKYLRDAAKIIVEKHGGKVPNDYAALRALPGVGDYTAKAVRVFAFNEPDVLIETNIRAVYIHHFYSSVLQKTGITDVQISSAACRAAARQNPRLWNWALMDYGVHLKKLHDNPTRYSAHYSMQNKFEGSLRQVRGAILKVLTNGAHGDLALAKKLASDAMRIRHALTALAHDGLIVSEKGSWRIV